MKPPPQIEADGLVAYEQVRAFEQLERRRLPMIYAAFVLLFIATGLGAGARGHHRVATVALATAVGCAVATLWNWRLLRARYRKNLLVLAQLEKEYGEDLPWLEVERHMAALDKLKRELAQEREEE